MNGWDVVLIIVLAVALAAAAAFGFKGRSGGSCCGNCSECAMHGGCEKKPDETAKE
ncbi:MAG: hypothetical protein J6P98_09120 [Clostridia bacterium]|nr:hypothetical protein [Clostridia bacterium]